MHCCASAPPWPPCANAEQQITQANELIAETGGLIADPIWIVAATQGNQYPPDAKHTLDIMIKLQASHVAYHDALERKLRFLDEAPYAAQRILNTAASCRPRDELCGRHRSGGQATNFPIFDLDQRPS